MSTKTRRQKWTLNQSDDEGGEELGTEEPAGDEDEEGIDIALQELFGDK